MVTVADLLADLKRQVTDFMSEFECVEIGFPGAKASTGEPFIVFHLGTLVTDMAADAEVNRPTIVQKWIWMVRGYAGTNRKRLIWRSMPKIETIGDAVTLRARLLVTDKADLDLEREAEAA